MTRATLRIVLCAAAAALATASPASAQVGCQVHLEAIDTSDVGSGAELRGVVAISQRDAWAVGSTGGGQNTLREHWNGRTWAAVPGPDPGIENTLEGVDAVSSTDVWAVGASFDGIRDRSLIEHWDGTRWTISPNPGNAGLLAVEAISATDVWAVGELLTILHWDGTSWSVVQHPPLEEGDLHGVSAAGSDDVWFVGAVESEGGGENTLALRWDGTLVSNVTTEIPNTEASELGGVVALSSTDVWAVGEMEEGGLSRTVIEHWDGVDWTLVGGPNPGRDENELRDISAISPTNILAVGGYATDDVDHPLAVRWNGTSWSVVPAEEPDPTDGVTEFNAISARSTHDTWAVGGHGPTDVDLDLLAERLRGCR